MANTYGPKSIVGNGLVFCVDAKDKQSYAGSGTAWNDLVNSNNGTLTNGPVHNGDYFTFDGTNDFSTHGNDSSVQLDHKTAAVWVRPHSIHDTTFFGRDNGSNRQWWLFFQTGGVIWWWDDTTDGTFSGNNAYEANVWTHICGTYDGAAMTLYKDGSQLASTARTGTSAVGSAALNIGNRDNNDRHLDGDIGCVHLYNRALSAAEVSQNFNAQRGRFGV